MPFNISLSMIPTEVPTAQQPAAVKYMSCSQIKYIHFGGLTVFGGSDWVSLAALSWSLSLMVPAARWLIDILTTSV